MKRGDIVTVAISGDYGKPRPAVIVQSDLFTQHDAHSIILCLLTSQIEPVKTFRLLIEPTENNGLQKPSQIMVDKIFTASRAKVGASIGALTKSQLQQLNRMLALVIGLA